jgi:hypothetical protein
MVCPRSCETQIPHYSHAPPHTVARQREINPDYFSAGISVKGLYLHFTCSLRALPNGNASGVDVVSLLLAFFVRLPAADSRLFHIFTFEYIYKIRVFTAMKSHVAVFRILTLCSLVLYFRRFGITYYLHPQGRNT